MHKIGKLSFVGAFTLIALGAPALPATASTVLGVDFNTTPSGQTLVNAGYSTEWLGYYFTVTAPLTVYALGTFDAGAAGNISVPAVIDLIEQFAPYTTVATATVGGVSGGTQVGSWLFNTVAGAPVTLTAGAYLVAAYLTTPDYVTVPLGNVSGGLVYNADISSNTTGAYGSTCCNGAGSYFLGANFDTAALLTPLPATIPLIAGGLGLVGMLTRRRKRKVTSFDGPCRELR
jgi:hypothetical protein